MKIILLDAYESLLKILNNANNNPESMLVLTILEKIKKPLLRFSRGSATVL